MEVIKWICCDGHMVFFRAQQMLLIFHVAGFVIRKYGKTLSINAKAETGLKTNSWD